MHALEPFERPPWIIAHRGVSAGFPENTMAAFDAAVDVGADAIECDIQLSLDGEWMVCHDRTLARYGHGHGKIHDMEAEPLRRLDMGRWFDAAFAGERMPCLSDMLTRYARVVPLCIEIKVRDEPEERKEAMVASLLAAIEGHPAARGLAFLSFDVDLLERIHVAAPSLPLVWNIRATERMHASDLSTRQWLWGIDLPVAAVATEAVEWAHDLGRVVLCYTCNTPADILAAMECGVDAIVTDDPEAARAVLLEER